MTYIDLINHFWRTRQTTDFTATEVDFYFTLLNECNLRGWENPFECSNKKISAVMDISEKSLISVRNRLKQKGMIDFEAGQRRKKSPVYTILNCNKVSKEVSKRVSYKVSKEVSKRVSKRVSLNKENREEENRDKRIDICVNEKLGNELTPNISFETPSRSPNFLEFNYTELKTELLNSQTWHEDLARLHNTQTKHVVGCINEFCDMLVTQGQYPIQLKEARKYFGSWFVKLKLNNVTNLNNKLSYAL